MKGGVVKCNFCEKTFSKTKKDRTPAKWEYLLRTHCMIKHKKEFSEFRKYMRKTKRTLNKEGESNR